MNGVKIQSLPDNLDTLSVDDLLDLLMRFRASEGRIDREAYLSDDKEVKQALSDASSMIRDRCINKIESHLRTRHGFK